MSSYTYFLCQSRCADAGDLNFIIYLFALFFFLFTMWRLEPKVLCMLGTFSTIELYFQLNDNCQE
jgi:hypothetical protein